MESAGKWLRGQHAIVTGASRGIGASVAAALAVRGATLTLMARSQEALADVAKALEKSHGVSVTPIACDVSSAESISRAFAESSAACGPASILVNNAGAAVSAGFADMTPAIWSEMLAINLTSVFLCSHAVLPSMLERRYGRIVNISSTSGLRGYKTMTAYCAAKHGVIGLTRALALETAAVGVTVNAVCPGYVETDILEQGITNLMNARNLNRDEARAMLLRPTPTGHFTTPEQVAGAVEWLCSSAAANVTGIALPVAGGEVQ